jgi:hypothetical protein
MSQTITIDWTQEDLIRQGLYLLLEKKREALVVVQAEGLKDFTERDFGIPQILQLIDALDQGEEEDAPPAAGAAEVRDHEYEEETARRAAAFRTGEG